MVAIAFLKNPENKPQVNHKNGIKTDNRLENLEWCTAMENMAHADKSGLWNVRGEKQHLAKLTHTIVVDIRNSNLSSRKLALIYKVDKSVILDAKNRITWKHI